MTLEPAFASDAVVYTAAADHDVTSTMVRATRLEQQPATPCPSRRARTPIRTNDSVPLDVGSNVITIEVTPAGRHPHAAHLHRHGDTRSPTHRRPSPRALPRRAAWPKTRVPRPWTSATQSRPPTPDSGDTLTYSLDDHQRGATFGIDASSGQLQTKAALDYED